MPVTLDKGEAGVSPPEQNAVREGGAGEERRPPLIALLKSLLFVLLVLVVGLRPLVPNSATAFSLHLILNLLIVSAATVYLLWQLQGKRIRIIKTGLEIPIIVFLAMILISIHVAVYKRPALLIGYSWICFFLLFLLIVNSVRGAERRILMWVLIASLLVVSLHGIHQRFIEIPNLRERLDTEPEEVLKEIGLPWAPVSEVRGRIEGSRVFSTFTLPNSLAGFLAMMFPVELALFLGVLRGGKRRLGRVSFYLFVIACTLMCVYLTRSKGGWLAFIVGVAVFVVWIFSDFLWRHRAAVAIVLIGFLALMVVAQLFQLTPPLRDYRDSFKVRYGYWRAGAKIIARGPVLGTGLGSWPDQYSIYKLAGDQETRRAHNDYVQLCVETGALGLVAYLWFWVGFFWRTGGVRGHSDFDRGPPSDEVQRLTLVAAAAGIPIFLAVILFETPLKNLGGVSTWLWPLGLWLAWSVVVMYMPIGASENRGNRRALAVGISAGLFAYLFHELIDFDLYVEGIAQTAFVLAGLLVAAQREHQAREKHLVNLRCGVGGSGILTGICVVVVLLVSFKITLPLANAKAARDRALSQTEVLPDAQRAELLETSHRLDPLDAETLLALSQLYERMWVRGIVRLYPAEPGTLALSVDRARSAQKLDPTGWSFQRQLARLYAILWARTRRADFLQESVRRYRAAYKLFPSNPSLAADLAVQYERKGDRAAALEMYKRALELDPDQYHHKRRKLKPASKKRIIERVSELEEGLKSQEPGS